MKSERNHKEEKERERKLEKDIVNCYKRGEEKFESMGV